LASAGRDRNDVTLAVGCIAAPCRTEEQLEAATRAVRFNLAFYGSTPAYRVTLDHHGLGELQPLLREATKAADWSRLGELVDDEVLGLLAAVGTPEEVADRLLEEYGGLADRLALTVAGGDDDSLAALVAAVSARASSPPPG
jgi:alkanesulfonate monooxygenase SsuD/methylene tetrahydromethanopterin reductase-like flavin-dependent oxidoreductase (luciferase family)